MAARTPNWARVGKAWLPLASLADDYSGPVVFADKSQSITWFSAKADRSAVDHSEHMKDGAGMLRFDDDGQPVMAGSTAEPAYWCPAEVTK